MRMRTLQATFIVTLSLASALAASAAPVFTLSATLWGTNQWAYVLTNSSTSNESAIALTLHWNAFSPQADLVDAQWNFDPFTGYVSVPTGWVANSGSYPVCSSTNLFIYKVNPGSSLSGLKLRYGTFLNSSPVAPGWFTVNYMNGTLQQATGWQPITDPPLTPEASGVLTLLAGITSVGITAIRRSISLAGRKKD
jgi:hypothetical protein